MDIILIPGLWLDGSSWDLVVPELERAGHRVHPLTLPGLESADADRSRVGRRDHVGAVVSVIDAVEGPVVLVGHSMGAGIAHAAVDARPDRVARAVYIGGFPTGDGLSSDDFPASGGEIPMPDWSEFDDADVYDLDAAARDQLRRRALPSPQRVLAEPQRLSDPRRYQVPVTMICPEFGPEDLRGWIAAGFDAVAELGRVEDLTYVDFDSGHWPQFTKPVELARVILDAIGHTED